MGCRYERPGENINYHNTGEPLKEGDIVLLGAHGVGVAGHNIDKGQTGSVWVRGVWRMPKDGGAVALGAPLYFDATAGKVTTTKATNTPVGWAVDAATAGDDTVLAKID